jgi:hypothetical protein
MKRTLKRCMSIVKISGTKRKPLFLMQHSVEKSLKALLNRDDLQLAVTVAQDVIRYVKMRLSKS